MSRNVEKILLAPILVEFTDQVKKVRLNLMLTSFISLFMTFGDIHIDPSSSIFGFKFKGLTDDLILNGIMILIYYFLINFLWCAYDSLQEWEVRISGTKEAFIRADYMDIDEAIKPPYPSDPRNATFYYWWSTQATKIGTVKTDFKKIYTHIEKIESIVHSMYEKGYELNRNDANISHEVQPLKLDIDSAVKSIDRMEKILKSDQLIISMKTFDRRYKYFLNSQNIRWFIIDFLTPIVLSGLAIFNIMI